MKVAIFDFDGVIVDTLNIKLESFKSVYLSDDWLGEYIEIIHLKNGGAPRDLKLKSLEVLRTGYIPTKKHLAEKVSKFASAFQSKLGLCKLTDGIVRVLERFATDNVHCCICSAAPLLEITEILKKLEIFHYFELIKGSENTKLNNLSSIIATFDYDLNEFLYFGDALVDYESAQKVGIPFVAVNFDPHLANELGIQSYKGFEEYDQPSN
jgi:phosphoglycolate phosphatase-like HAD superfamily hydrolase